MRTAGRIFAGLSIVGMFFGMIPFLGWMNWFNIPFAIIGLIFSILGKSKGGIILSVIAIGLGMLRLFMGGGII